MTLWFDLLARMFVDDVDWDSMSAFRTLLGTKKRLMDYCILSCFACIF